MGKSVVGGSRGRRAWVYERKVERSSSSETVVGARRFVSRYGMSWVERKGRNPIVWARGGVGWLGGERNSVSLERSAE